MILSASQVLGYALKAGFSRVHANTMVAISWYEARWDTNAVGDLTLSHFGSVGLWQIFTGAHTPSEVGVGSGAWTQPLVDALKDPTANAHAARVVLDEQGYKAWSTYNTYHGTSQFLDLVAKVAALGDPNAPAPVPAPSATVTVTLVQTDGVWSVKA